MPEGAKHLIECNCVLPQFKYRNPPIYHHFVVFSVFNEQGLVMPSYAQCPNCGIIHKVVEVGKSIIMRKEELGSILTEEELRQSLPEKLGDILAQYKVDYATWQQAKFIVENELWGRSVILTKDEAEGVVTGKFLTIIGTTLWKIDNFHRDRESDNLIGE